MGFRVESFPAKWDLYGRAAGPIRNQEMLDVGKPSLVVYFHSDLKDSKGTKDMVERATKSGIEVINGSQELPKSEKKGVSPCLQKTASLEKV